MRQIDAGLLPETNQVRVKREVIDSGLAADGVEVRVAGVHDGVVQCNRTVPVFTQQW